MMSQHTTGQSSALKSKAKWGTKSYNQQAITCSSKQKYIHCKIQAFKKAAQKPGSTPK